MSDGNLDLWTRTESPERYNGSSEDHITPSHAKMLQNTYPKSFHTSEALQPAFSEVTADVANSENGRASTGSIKEEITRIVTQLRTDGDPDGGLLAGVVDCIPLTYPDEQLYFGHLYEEHPEIRRLQHLLQKLLQSEDDDLEWFKRLVADIVAEINPGIKGVLDRITILCNKNLGQEKKILIQLRKFVEELMEGDAGAQNRKPEVTSLENDIRSLHPKYWSTVLQLVHNTKRKLDLVHFNRLLEAAIKGKSIVEIEQMIEFVYRIAYDHPSVGMDLMLNPIDGSSEIMRLMYECPDVDLKSGYVALATHAMVSAEVSAEVEQPKVLKRSASELEGAKKRPKKGK